jgi:SAM-dependent methyltransferase
MSGFSPDWLALREPADHDARNAELLDLVAQRFEGREGVRVLDLGCGTGSNLRGSWNVLPDWQHWTLVDFDSRLLDAARENLTRWADQAEVFGEELLLTKGRRHVTVDLRKADLTTDLDKLLDWRPDFVTASALFDLVSPQWLEDFVAALAKRKLPLYTVLTYDGREEWQPPHQADAAMLAAFNAHQRRDKGFGPSAGPDATDELVRRFKKRGYEVETAASPWTLGPSQAGLTKALTAGIADAVRETGAVGDDDIVNWLISKEKARSGTIGHLDLWAVPPAT